MGFHYVLENRYYPAIYHWFIYMLGGLRHIKEEGKVAIYVNDFNPAPVHSDSLKCIEDKYVFKAPNPFSEVKNMHGEPLMKKGDEIIGDDVDHDTYKFVRELFLSRLPAQTATARKIYLSLKSYEDSSSIRKILNEDDHISALKEAGYEIMNPKDMSFGELVKIFNSSAEILCPSSEVLIYSLFAGEKTTIVEITPRHVVGLNHTKNMCEALGINYKRCIDVDATNTPICGSTFNLKFRKDAVAKLTGKTAAVEPDYKELQNYIKIMIQFSNKKYALPIQTSNILACLKLPAIKDWEPIYKVISEVVVEKHCLMPLPDNKGVMILFVHG